MSTASMGGASTRRQRGGKWRGTGSTALSWGYGTRAVAWLVPLVFAGRWVMLDGWIVTVAILVVWGCGYRRVARAWLRWWWALRWFSDVRAGGLTRIAEQSYNRDAGADQGPEEIGPLLLGVKITRFGRRYVCRPLPSMTFKMFEDAVEALKLQWRATSVVVSATRGRWWSRGNVAITVVTRDPLERSLDATPRGTRRPEPVSPAPVAMVPGRTETGGPIEISLAFHSLIVGSTGGGKSVALRGLLVELARRRDVQLVLVDPKHVEFAGWRRRPIGVARDPEEIEACLRWVTELMDERYRQLSVRGLTGWHGGLGSWLVVVLDEVADVFDLANDAGDLLEHLGRKARAAGIALVCATQRASADLLPSSFRGNLAQRVVLRTDNADATEFGLPGRSKEYPAHQIPIDQPGLCYVLPASGTIERARVSFVAEAAVALVDRETEHLRSRLWATARPEDLVAPEVPHEAPSRMATAQPAKPASVVVDDADLWAELHALDVAAEDPAALTDDERLVLAAVAGTPRPAGAIAAACGISEGRARRARQSLAARGRIVDLGGLWRIA